MYIALMRVRSPGGTGDPGPRALTEMWCWSNLAHTDFPPSVPVVVVPQLWLRWATMEMPRPEVLMTCGTSVSGRSGDLSRTVSSTESASPCRVTLKAVCA